MALATLSVLFLFKLPDVSRLFLAGPVPGPGGRHDRVAGRPAMDAGATTACWPQPPTRARPRRGAAWPGLCGEARGPPGAWAPNRRLPRRRDWLRVARPVAVSRRSRSAGRDPAHECRGRGRDRPALLAMDSDRRDLAAVRGGGEDRPHPDGRAGSGHLDRAHRGTRRHACLLAGVGPGSDLGAGDQARRWTSRWRPSGSCSYRRCSRSWGSPSCSTTGDR